jgi:hypothetical protein
MDNDLVSLIYQSPARLLKGEKLAAAIISRYKPGLLKIPTDRGLLCNSSPLGSLTRRFYRRALIKAEYWADHGMPDWLASISRYGMGRLLEKSFVGRDKFQHFRLWTQQNFVSEYITDVLLQKGGCPEELFIRGKVESIVTEHLAGRRNHTEDIDKILTLTLAYRILINSCHTVPFGWAVS